MKKEIIKSNFALNLRSLRRQKGWSQNELAELLAVKRNKIASYETGIAEPNLMMLIKIANQLSVTIDDLLKGIHYKIINDDIQYSSGIEDKQHSFIEVLVAFEEFTDMVRTFRDGYLAFSELAKNEKKLNDPLLEEKLIVLDNLLDINSKLISSLKINQSDQSDKKREENQ